MYEQIMAEYAKLIPLAGIMEIISIAFRVLFMMAIGYDCKAKNNSKKTMWMVLTFFFPIIAGIVYACTRNKNVPPQSKNCAACGAVLDTSVTFCPNCGSSAFALRDGNDSAKAAKTSKILFGCAVVAYVVSVIVSSVYSANMFSTLLNSVDDFDDFESIIGSSYDEGYGVMLNGKMVYYDREGRAYDEYDDVLYYDKNGATYTYEADDFCYEDTLGNKYDFAYCFVDEEGYFFFDEKEEISYLDMTEMGVDVYADSNGKIYFYADLISWDDSGKMVDKWGEPIEYTGSNVPVE